VRPLAISGITKSPAIMIKHFPWEGVFDPACADLINMEER